MTLIELIHYINGKLEGKQNLNAMEYAFAKAVNLV